MDIGTVPREQLEDLFAALKVDRAAVVRINQTEFQEFVSLIDVWNSGRCEFQESLREAVEQADARCAADKFLEIDSETILTRAIEDSPNKVGQRTLVV